MKILTKNDLNDAAAILIKGGIIAFPTETVFGLGVIYDNKNSYDRLVSVKRRPPEKPFTLMLSDPEDVAKYAKLNDDGKAIVKNFMPGQITIVCPAQPGLPTWCVAKDGTIGLRVADYDLVRELIRKVGKPLLVPSANKSGEKPSCSTTEVVNSLGSELDAIIDGETKTNTPSTIIIINDSGFQIAREGAVKLEDINKVIK